jgi:hypothetical protein
MIKPVSIILVTCLLAISNILATPMRIIDALKGVNNGDQFGQSCEGMGDVNGDGYNDFLVSCRTLNELYFYLGGSHPFDNPPVITWSNHSQANGMKSFSPVNVGDVDEDGVDDFISLFGNGDTLRLFLGLENQNANDYMTLFTFESIWWRFEIGGGGDNNNDGRTDFWIQPYKSFLHDTIWGYSGGDQLDNIPDFWILKIRDPDNQYLSLGRDFCSHCDLNGDLIPDIIYGQYADLDEYPGRICITWGSESISETPDLMFYAPVDADFWQSFGKDIACLGDISGDNIDDLWISQGKRNYIYFGGQPFDTFPDVTIYWPHMYPDIENVGDINNDGYNDVVLVEEGYLFSYFSYIYCYPEMDTIVDVVYTDGDFYNTLQMGSISNVGIDHSWAGDIDGDGIDDILISARQTDNDIYDHGYLIIQAGWDGDPTPVEESEMSIPEGLELNQNYPNPFNSGTTIEFNLPQSGFVELKIYNLLGELICIPLQNHLLAGDHTINWNGKDATGNICPTGVYFYQINSDGYSETKRMILLK